MGRALRSPAARGVGVATGRAGPGRGSAGSPEGAEGPRPVRGAAVLVVRWKKGGSCRSPCGVGTLHLLEGSPSPLPESVL